VIGGAGKPQSIVEDADAETLFEATAPIRPWPRRRRFLFIVGAASLAWLVPALLLYLVFGL